MKTAMLLCTVALAACRHNQAPAPTQLSGVTGELSELAWLAGSWSSEKGDTVVEEHWTSPSTNLMLGINRTVSAGMTVHHEQLRIELRPDGVFYIASPSGQQTTEFKMVERGSAHAVFENPEHDYPKRITYRRSGRSLTVRIEGASGDRVSEWHWQRATLPVD